MVGAAVVGAAVVGAAVVGAAVVGAAVVGAAVVGAAVIGAAVVGAAVVGAAVVGAAVVGAAVVGAAVVGAAVVGAAVLVLGSRPQNLKLLAVCPAFGEFPAYKQKSPAGAVRPFTLVHTDYRCPRSKVHSGLDWCNHPHHTSSPQHRPPGPVQFVPRRRPPTWKSVVFCTSQGRILTLPSVEATLALAITWAWRQQAGAKNPAPKFRKQPPLATEFNKKK